MAYPEPVLKLAEKRRLGRPVRVFGALVDRRRTIAWLVLLGTAGVLLVPSAGYYLAAGPLWLGLLGSALAIGYLCAVAWILYVARLAGWGRVTYLFEHGFVRAGSGRGTGPEAYPWDDLREVRMAGVQRARRRPTSWRFTVTTADGRTVSLGDEIPDVRGLGELVVAEVTRRVVPRYLAELEAGRTVELGPFRLSRTVIEKDGETLAWSELREVVIKNGMVYVRRHDNVPVMATTAATMPNAIALAELCHRVRTGARR